MKVKVELIERIYPKGSHGSLHRTIVRLPDGDELFQTDTIEALLFRLESIGMNFDKGFTVETEDDND